MSSVLATTTIAIRRYYYIARDIAPALDIPRDESDEAGLNVVIKPKSRYTSERSVIRH